ncbi:hypothetical protein [Salicibibacter halophilus]|nr:hypothetical protein [Salicibibacter halophilus]
MNQDRRIKIHKHYVSLFQDLKTHGIVNEYQQLFMIAFALGAKHKQWHEERDGLTAIIRAVIFSEDQINLMRSILYEREKTIHTDDDTLTKAESIVTTGLEYLTRHILSNYVSQTENGNYHLIPGNSNEVILSLGEYVYQDSTSIPF